MKLNKCLLLFAAFALVLLINMQCKKDNQNPASQLPPATQEGKDTFGCLVNGEVFLPKGAFLGRAVLTSYYQYLNSPTAQGYFFNISASRNESGQSRGVSIGANNVLIKQGVKYVLKNYQNVNEVYASYTIVSGGEINEYPTREIHQGELYISKFDDINQIVSGTFWFDGVNNKGEKVEVREGRFDVHFVN